MPEDASYSQQILRFAQDFGSGLTPSTTLRVTPAKRLNFRFPKSGGDGFLAALRPVSGDGHRSALADHIFIVAHGGLAVCDGRHRCL